MKNNTIKEFNLKNKVCIITGGTGLLGKEFSRACAEHNAIVIIVDIDKKKGDVVVKEIQKDTHNDNIFFEKCDITSVEEVKLLVKRIKRRFGKIDALVNNAYPRNKRYGRKFEDVACKDFCENVNMHLGGYFLTTQEIAKVMIKQKRGIIVFLGSIYGFAAPKFDIYYKTNMKIPVASIELAAIKGGILQLTKYLAAYLAPHQIRVNAISPGGVFDNQPELFVKKYLTKVRLGSRMAYPDDISGALIFLLSDASKYMTGQNIIVDGGWSI